MVTADCQGILRMRQDERASSELRKHLSQRRWALQHVLRERPPAALSHTLGRSGLGVCGRLLMSVGGTTRLHHMHSVEAAR